MKTYVEDEPENYKEYRCCRCGMFAEIIWIHGSYKCSNCGQVIISCCEGAERMGQLPNNFD